MAEVKANIIRHRNSTRRAYIAYALVALSIMLPLLSPGFILTLDMAFTPEIRMPAEITNTYPFYALLHLLNLLAPSALIQKIMLLGIMLLASIGMHRFVEEIRRPHSTQAEWGIYVASVFFAVNPFTYSRFMAGQYAVLLGYALLPWFGRALLRFAAQPTLRHGFVLGGLATLIGVVSIHTLGEIVVLCVAAGAVGLWLYRRKLARLSLHLKSSLASLAVFVGASSYWLAPLLLGKSTTAELITRFGVADIEAFQTLGDNLLLQILNVLRLQGFWAEGRGLYLLPQDLIPLWGTLFLVILCLVVYGAKRLWHARPAVTAWLIASGTISLILAAGVGVEWLATHVPLLAGYREPHKFAGLVVLGYAVFLASGIDAVLGRAAKKAGWLYTFAAIGLLLLPVLVTRPMWWGFGGQLSPRHYPAGWTAANNRLNQDNDTFNVIFLPWHQYMSFGFTERIIANPAPAFFDKPTIVSNDPELGGASGGISNALHESVQKVVKNSTRSEDFCRQLASNNIKYVLLAKKTDATSYAYLRQHPGLTLVQDGSDITLYLNTLWGKQ